MQPIALILTALEQSRNSLLRALRGGADPKQPLPELPREVLEWRPAPGSHSVGRLLWHIADTEDEWVSKCVLKQEFMPRFGVRALDRGTQIPSWDGLIRYLHESRARTVEALSGLSPEALDETVSFYKRHVPLGNVLTRLVWHEAWHGGQIAHVLGHVRRAGWEPTEA